MTLHFLACFSPRLTPRLDSDNQTRVSFFLFEVREASEVRGDKLHRDEAFLGASTPAQLRLGEVEKIAVVSVKKLSRGRVEARETQRIVETAQPRIYRQVGMGSCDWPAGTSLAPSALVLIVDFRLSELDSPANWQGASGSQRLGRLDSFGGQRDKRSQRKNA